ncbi:uncharacterized protein GIQ15_03785 [Arthroderma uncinatum]|uniref:uncharacterized protein n=1 Tax=Arthroderma uncinatum TaxID=74035 RepID=UPI00144AA87C|nr:uncharacterized protein GIQ15_03785 [Arthroderma uncinatum]KAF3484461.1 hypothetical protein GIQ15_03785 [Arthroderma uncinatum]
MDIYGTAATALQHVVQVTIFIKGVISDIREYDNDRATIDLKLDLQLTSLEFFRRRFLHEKHGLMLPGNLPEWIADTICKLLVKLNRVLAEYQVVVGRYEDFDDKMREMKVNDEPETVSKREKWKKSFYERAKSHAKSLKVKGYDWSLFEKKKLLAIIEEYQGWTSSLRDLMQHFSQETVYNIADSSTSPSPSSDLEGTGLEHVVQRQKLASALPPDDFRQLQGEIVEEDAASSRFRLTRWTHNGESTQVLVEYREYDRRLRYDDLDPEEIAELKAPVRNLAWLLQSCTFQDAGDPESQLQQPAIYSLQCLGFMDQAEKERYAFVYKLPFRKPDAESNELLTLHDLITKTDPKTRRPLKTSLSDRFSIAHCLALTLSNIHASLWLHKNIWSRGILLFQQCDKEGITPLEIQRSLPTSTDDAERPQAVAFIGDWGYARHIEGATDMKADFEIEPNLYRHPERQGAPTRQFAPPHDIYALGVVLLEIGLWKTVSQLFDARIQVGQRTGKLPKAKEVKAVLIALAQTELPREMGSVYAAAVIKCLTGDFRKNSDVELSLDFREKVVDSICLGMKL